MASLFFGLYVWIATRDFTAGIDTLFTYSVHGVANICRGMIEFLPFVGNYICKIYDDEEKNRWTYLYEKERSSLLVV